MPADDEISLVDLGLTLVRWRWWFFGIAAAVMVAGVGFAALQADPRQQYTTTLEFAQSQPGRLLSGRAESVAVLERVVIPELRRSRAEELGFGQPGVEVETVENAPLLVLTSSAPAARRDRVVGMHEAVAERFLAREAEAMDERRRDLARELEVLDEDLADEMASIEAAEERIGRELALAREWLEDLEAERETLLRRRDELAATAGGGEGAGDPAAAERAAAGLAGLANEILLNREERAAQYEEIARLEERLGGLALEGSEARRSGERRRAEVERNLDRLVEAQTVWFAAEDGAAGGNRAGLIVALSVVLGLMLGLFGAFFREFAEQVRRAANAEAPPKPDSG